MLNLFRSNQILDYFARRSITAIEITQFLQQFATMLNAGVGLTQCCETLAKSQPNETLRLIIYSIKRDVQAGKSLLQSMLNYPNYFDEFTCELVHIGEQTGKLDHMLNRIISYQEKRIHFKQEIKRACFYPMFVCMTAFLITFCMLIFVIPKFADLFHDTQASLPRLTLLIFYIATHLRAHLWIAFILIVMLLIPMLRYKKSKRVQQWLSGVLFNLPYLRTFLRHLILARFARHLAISYAAGIPINDALRLAASTTGNMTFTAATIQLRSHVNAGIALHQAMSAILFFPGWMIQMVKTGEESGSLELVLNQVADFFEANTERTLSRLSQLLEPLIMLVLGALIGGIVIGMYLPIFKLGSAF